eukprot:scaffold33584_cov45-Phaeocystis_antarctica.AAC.1
MGACPMWPNQSAHAQQPLIAMQRRAPNNFSALATCQLQTSSCGAFTFKGRDGAGCCCSWRTRPASGSLTRPAESDRFAWWVHPRALGSRTSGCAQILDKEALAYQGGQPLTGHASFLSTLAMWMAWQDRYSPVRGDVPYYHSLCCLDSKFVSWSPERHQPVSSGVLSRLVPLITPPLLATGGVLKKVPKHLASLARGGPGSALLTASAIGLRLVLGLVLVLGLGLG